MDITSLSGKTEKAARIRPSVSISFRTHEVTHPERTRDMLPERLGPHLQVDLGQGKASPWRLVTGFIVELLSLPETYHYQACEDHATD